MASPNQRGFNPRAPRGARRGLSGQPDELRCVSIHAPRAGRDGQVDIGAVEWTPVSIHAPRAGRDA